MAKFGPNSWTNPFGKNSIFGLSQHLVFIAQKGVLSLQNTIKHIFLAYIPLKREDGKTANVGPQPWTNPFGKNSIFPLTQHLVFIGQKRFLSLQNIIKYIFLAYVALKKEDGKWPILDLNHGLTPLEKTQFYRLSQHLLFIA